MRTVPASSLVLALTALLQLGCVESRSVVVHQPERTIPPGRWSVDGVVLDMTMDEVRAAAGEPEHVMGRQHAPLWKYPDNRTNVTFDAEGRVREVAGEQLWRDGSVVLRMGSPETLLEPLLGEGRQVEFHRPVGDGPFQTETEHWNTDHFYRRDAEVLHVFVRKGHVGSLRLTWDPPTRDAR
ncbi:MAG: hypothetical protein AAF533_20080 [Acidobacteriota bacterium]